MPGKRLFPGHVSAWFDTGTLLFAFLIAAFLIAAFLISGSLGAEDFPADISSPREPLASGGQDEGTLSKESPKEPEFDPAQLEGPDAKVAELAAHRLLQAIATKSPAEETSRAAHLNFLLEKLQPARLAQAALTSPPELVSAERIIDALATWITSSGPPFARASEVVQPLLGVGPAHFRDAVLRAHKALVLYELKSAKRHELDPRPATASSATLGALAGKLAEIPPPSESFFRDAATVLWETDGKTLLGTLVTVLANHAGSPPGTQASRMAALCAAELQSRVSLSFPTVEGWQQWWKDSKDLTLDKIVADCQRRTRDEYLANWRQLLRRLRETGDAERLLQAIQDTLDGVSSGELRVAAVTALGEFAEWVLDMRPSVAAATPRETTGAGGAASGAPGSAPGANGNDAKDRLLAKAVQRLAAFFEGGSFSMERPEVLRAALSALRKYHAFLERTPQLLAVVSRIVAERIQAFSIDGGEKSAGEKNREDLLETIRLAGALRVTQAQSFVEALLRDERPAQEDDVELITTSIVTLGRLLEKGVSPENAALLTGQYRKQRQASEKLVRELRRACVTALSAGSDAPEVRADLRAFFKEILPGAPAAGAAPAVPQRGDKDLRIPAILGLGTLARQKDTGAFEALIEVIAHGDLFEPQEVIAAIDSVAYVGGRPAIVAFLRSLGAPHDKMVEEHLWKKVTGLVETGGGPVLVSTLEALETRAIEEDSTAPLERSVALCGSPQVEDLLSTEKLDPSSDGRLESLWKASMALARAQDAVGKEEELVALLAKLSGLLQKTPQARERLADGAAAIAAIRASLSQRSALKPKLGRSDAGDPMALLKEIDALLAADPSVPGRWRNLRWTLHQLPPGSPQERLRALWRTSLSSEQSRVVWDGFPAEFRERFLARMEKP